MICVDTSVWIRAFRDAASNEARQLGDLLDADEVALPAPVRVELLAGSPKRQFRSLRQLLSALPYWRPGDSTWTMIDDWLGHTVESNQRFGATDLLIAAITSDRGARLWSLDGDFNRMARLGFVELYAG